MNQQDLQQLQPFFPNMFIQHWSDFLGESAGPRLDRSGAVGAVRRKPELPGVGDCWDAGIFWEDEILPFFKKLNFVFFTFLFFHHKFLCLS